MCDSSKIVETEDFHGKRTIVDEILLCSAQYQVRTCDVLESFSATALKLFYCEKPIDARFTD